MTCADYTLYIKYKSTNFLHSSLRATWHKECKEEVYVTYITQVYIILISWKNHLINGSSDSEKKLEEGQIHEGTFSGSECLT